VTRRLSFFIVAYTTEVDSTHNISVKPPTASDLDILLPFSSREGNGLRDAE
jgi:hypothetical protein